MERLPARILRRQRIATELRLWKWGELVEPGFARAGSVTRVQRRLGVDRLQPTVLTNEIVLDHTLGEELVGPFRPNRLAECRLSRGRRGRQARPRPNLIERIERRGRRSGNLV